MRCRELGILGGLTAALTWSCAAPSSFFCAVDEECEMDGEAGTCESSGHCSFPRGECPSGRAYGEHAPEVLANACVVDPEVGTDTDIDTDVDTDIDPDADVDTSTGEPEPHPESPSGGSTAASETCPWEGMPPPSCLEQYGFNSEFELCEETATTCRFAASVVGHGCAGVCEAAGGACLAASGNGELACEPTSPSECSRETNSNDICTCTRGCG